MIVQVRKYPKSDRQAYFYKTVPGGREVQCRTLEEVLDLFTNDLVKVFGGPIG